MADTRLSLIVEMKDKASQALKSINKEMDSLADAGTKVGQTFGSIALAGGGLIAGITKSASTMEDLENAMNGLTGSAEETEKRLKELKEIARQPGVDFEGAVSGDIRLQNLGLSAEQAAKSIVGLGKGLAKSGKSGAEFPELVDAFAKMNAEGKIIDEQLDRMTSRIDVLGPALQDAFGGQSSQKLNELGVSIEEFNEVITETLGSMDVEGADSFSNAISNMRTEWMFFALQMTDTILPVMSSLVNSISGAVAKIGEWASKNPQLADIASKILLIGTAVAGVIAAFGFMFPVINNAIAALGALKTLLLGVNPVFLAIAAVVGAFALAWKNNWGDIQGKTKAVIEWILPKVRMFVNAIKEGFTELTRFVRAVMESQFFKWMKDSFDRWFKDKQGVFKAFTALVKFAFDAVITAATWMTNTMSHITRAFTSLVQGDLTGVFTAIHDFLGSIANLAISALEALMNGFIAGFNKLSTKISEWTDGLVNLGQQTEVSLDRVAISAKRASVEIESTGEVINNAGGAVNDLGGATDDLTNNLDDLGGAAGGAASSGLEEFKKFAEDTNKQLEELQGKIKGVSDEMEAATNKYNEGVASNRQDLAKVIVDTEKQIEELEKERSNISEQLRSADTQDQKDKLQEQLEGVKERLLEETIAYEQHSSIINELNAEVEEARRWESLTTLQKAVENYNKEQALLQKQFSEKMRMMEEEKNALTAQQEEIARQVEQRVKTVKEQYGAEAEAYTMLLEENNRVTAQVLQNMINYYNRLAKARKEAGVGGMIDINRFIAAPEVRSLPAVPQGGSGSAVRNAINVVVNGDVSGEDLAEKVGDKLLRILNLSTFTG